MSFLLRFLDFNKDGKNLSALVIAISLAVVSLLILFRPELLEWLVDPVKLDMVSRAVVSLGVIVAGAAATVAGNLSKGEDS